jgi:hypothetical protein
MHTTDHDLGGGTPRTNHGRQLTDPAHLIGVTAEADEVWVDVAEAFFKNIKGALFARQVQDRDLVRRFNTPCYDFQVQGFQMQKEMEPLC